LFAVIDGKILVKFEFTNVLCINAMKKCVIKITTPRTILNSMLARGYEDCHKDGGGDEIDSGLLTLASGGCAVKFCFLQNLRTPFSSHQPHSPFKKIAPETGLFFKWRRG